MIARLARSQTARHGAIVFLGVAATSLFNYLYYMLIGRRLGVDGYGVVTSLASALLVVGTPAVVGQLITARLAADLEVRGDLGALRRLADLVTRWTTLVGLAIIVIGLLARNLIAAFFNLSDSSPVVVTVVSLSIFIVVMVQRGVFQGSQRFGEFSASTVIEAVTKAIGGVVFAALFGPTGALAVFGGALALALGFNLVMFRVRFPVRATALAFDTGVVRRVATHVGLGQLTLTALAFYDVPLVKHFFEPHSAGLYAAAALVGRSVLAAASFIPTLVLPKATARIGAGLSPLPLLGAALALAALIVGLILGFALVAPRTLVTIIAGPPFGDAASIVLLYVAASSALALAGVVAAYKMGLHRFDFVKPALGLALFEAGVIWFWHPSLRAVVGVLLAGHSAVFVATLFRLTAKSTMTATAPSSERMSPSSATFES